MINQIIPHNKYVNNFQINDFMNIKELLFFEFYLSNAKDMKLEKIWEYIQMNFRHATFANISKYLQACCILIFANVIPSK